MRLQFSIRFPSDLIAEIDDFVRSFNVLHGTNLTRTDAIRLLVKRGLDSERAKSP